MTDTTNTPPAAAAPQIVVAVENFVHTVEVKVEAGWAWVETEFTHLSTEAKAVYAWVQNEDPQLAAYMRQLMLKWEGQAAQATQAEAGALGNLINNEGATIETGVANFTQGVLGKLNLQGGDVSKEAISYLITKGEGVLQSLLGRGLAKVLGALVTPGA